MHYGAAVYIFRSVDKVFYGTALSVHPPVCGLYYGTILYAYPFVGGVYYCTELSVHVCRYVCGVGCITVKYCSWGVLWYSTMYISVGRWGCIMVQHCLYIHS